MHLFWGIPFSYSNSYSLTIWRDGPIKTLGFTNTTAAHPKRTENQEYNMKIIGGDVCLWRFRIVLYARSSRSLHMLKLHSRRPLPMTWGQMAEATILLHKSQRESERILYCLYPSGISVLDSHGKLKVNGDLMFAQSVLSLLRRSNNTQAALRDSNRIPRTLCN